jgi:hypothetical protein
LDGVPRMRFEPYLLTMIFAAAAAADQPPVALPSTIADTSVPALSCVQPDLPDLSKLTSKELKSIEAQIKSYGDCLQRYIDDRHANSDLYVNLQKAEVDAGNATVKIFNAFFAQVRELQNKQRAQPASKTPQ